MKSNYEFKDAFIILKAVIEKAQAIYNSKAEVIVNQLLKTEDKQYRSAYGLFNLKLNKEKTIKVYTKQEQEEVEKLKAQIEKLKAKIDSIGKTKVVSDSYYSLVCHDNAIAEEAEALLQELIADIGNASMMKASKTTRG